MSKIYKISSRYSSFHTGSIRDRGATSEAICNSLSELGSELGRHILVAHRLEPKVVTTPLNEDVEVLTLARSTTLVVTTKSDSATFGAGIASVLTPSYIGSMSFEGIHGLEALRSPIRDIAFPKIEGRVDTLVVAKSTLATGCTAISLTRTVLEEFSPSLLVIATVFYSLEGLQEISQAFPQAVVYCVGEPDRLGEDGMLRPGIGMLEERMMLGA